MSIEALSVARRFSRKPTPNQIAMMPQRPEAVQHLYEVDPEFIKTLRQTSDRLGSNPGGMHVAPDGSNWYLKYYEGPMGTDRAKNEKLTTELYKAAGVPVSDEYFTEWQGRPAIASPIVEGKELEHFKDYNDIKELRENYPVDAWLLNYDAVGTGYINVIVDDRDVAWRIDTGGGLRYRAKGQLKRNLSGAVDELKGMLDPKLNKWIATVFKGIKISQDDPSFTGALRVASVPDDVITDLVDTWGPPTQAAKDQLAKIIIARKRTIAKAYGIQAKQEGGRIVFDPQLMDTPHKFYRPPEKSANQRVMEGHQEFEGFVPPGDYPWDVGDQRPILNMRGQESLAIKAQGGGAMDDEDVMDVPGVGPVPTSVPEPVSKVATGMAKSTGEWLATPHDVMQQQTPQMPETGELTEEQEYLRRAGIAEQAEKQAEFGPQTAMAMYGAQGPFPAPGGLGIAGGAARARRRPDIHPDFGRSAADKAQDVANELVRIHGDDHGAISNDLRGLSPEAQDMVFDRLPKNIRYGIKTDDAYAAETQAYVQEAAKERGVDLSQQTFSTPGEAKEWLRLTGRDPNEWGYKDPHDYIHLADVLSRAPEGVSDLEWLSKHAAEGRRETPAPTPSIDLTELFSVASPATIKSLNNQQIRAIEEALVRSGQSDYYRRLNPELMEALQYESAMSAMRHQTEALAPREWESIAEAPVETPVPRKRFIPGQDPGPFSALHGAFTEYFNNHLKQHYGNMNDFAKEYFGNLNTKHITAIGNYDGSLYFDGNLYTKGPDKKYVGRIERTIDPNTKVATHNFFRLDPQYMSTEVGPTILRNQMDLYKNMGLTHVKVHAALDGGGYAWAKYGFIPEQKSWNYVRKRTLEAIDKNWLNIPDKDVRNHVVQLLQNENPRTIWDISDITAPDSHGTPLGKSILMGDGSHSGGHWSGYFHINDAESGKRFDRYVARKPKKKAPSYSQ